MSVFKFQLGQFFLVIGVFMLAVFFVTVQSQSPQFALLFGGVLGGVFGISLMTRNRKRPEESARFRRVRRYRQKARERQEKKRQKRQERRERASQSQPAQRQMQSQPPRERQTREQQEQRERQS
jgi:sugar phosphate permease